jgi:hypothetical protein
VGIIKIITIAPLFLSYRILTTMCGFLNFFSALSGVSGKIFLFRSLNIVLYNALSQVSVQTRELLCGGRAATTAEAKTPPSADATAVKSATLHKVIQVCVFIGYADGLALCRR